MDFRSDGIKYRSWRDPSAMEVLASPYETSTQCSAALPVQPATRLFLQPQHSASPFTYPNEMDSSPDYSERSDSPPVHYHRHHMSAAQAQQSDRRGLGPRNTKQKAHRAKADRSNQSGCLQACHDFLIIGVGLESRSFQSKSNGKKSGLLIGKEEVQRVPRACLEYGFNKIMEQAIIEGREDEVRREFQLVAQQAQSENDSKETSFRLPKSSMMVLDDDDEPCEYNVDDENSSACVVHHGKGGTSGAKADWRICRMDRRRHAYKINRNRQIARLRSGDNARSLTILSGNNGKDK